VISKAWIMNGEVHFAAWKADQKPGITSFVH